MEKTEIFEKLKKIFKDVLDLEETPNLTNETCADDFEGWDSLSHIQLIVAIEKEFGIKFTAKEMLDWETVGNMVDCIFNKK